MSGIAKITDHWTETVSDYILEQYKDAPNWKAILKAVVDKFSIIEDQVWKLAEILDFKCRLKQERPSGVLLDFIAGIVNLTRYQGESDADFYARFLSFVGDDSAGTPDNIIYNSAILSGDPEPQYIDEADATLFVYTGPRNKNAVPEGQSFDYGESGKAPVEGGANQLLRRQVKQLAPAGVLGLPGAAIQFADGSFMGDAQGRIFLAAADDSTARREMLVVDNNLAPIMTSQGVPLRATIVGATVPRVEIEYNGVPADAVRIKDLPDAGEDNSYMVRDSDASGTGKTAAMDGTAFDELWDNTPAEGEE